MKSNVLKASIGAGLVTMEGVALASNGIYVS